MERRELLRFLEKARTQEEIEQKFENIQEDLDLLYQKEKILYYEEDEKRYFVKSDHNFKLSTSRKIGQSAAFICSNPECRKLTISGSNLSKGKIIKIGEAAHIIGNKASSARYKMDPNIKRSSVENGIWLCRNCHRMIDSNKGKDYPIKLLFKWKEKHIKYLSKNLGKPINLNSDNFITGQDFEAWSNNPDIKYPSKFVSDPKTDLLIKNIKEKLNTKELKNQVIRLSGLSGLGKTRILFEVIKNSNLKEKTYYYEDASLFLKSDIFMMLKNGVQMDIILIIDDCSLKEFVQIKNKIDPKQNKLIIITIGFHNEIHDKNENYFEIDYMEKDLIERILKSNFDKIPKREMEDILNASLCFPKFAIEFIYKYLQSKNKRYITNKIDVERLIFGKNDNNNRNLIKKIITYITLFSPLGYSGKIKDDYFQTSERIGYPLGNLNDKAYNEFLNKESKWLCKSLEINYIDFTQFIDQLIKKGIIIKNYQIQIVPIPLIYYFINEWWEYNNEKLDIIKDIPEDLKIGFLNRFFININVFTLVEKHSSNYSHIINFLKYLGELEIYNDKILDFCIDHYGDFDHFNRVMLLGILMKREDNTCKFFEKLLLERFYTLKQKEKKYWFNEVFNKVPVEKLTSILNKWPHMDNLNNNLKRFIITKVEHLVDKMNWNKSILKSLFFYYDFLSERIKEQFIEELEENLVFVSSLMILPYNLPSEDSKILICKQIFKINNSSQEYLKILSTFHSFSLKSLRRLILKRLSKDEKFIEFLFMFIIQNHDLLDENIIKNLIEDTNKFNPPLGRAFQYSLLKILHNLDLETHLSEETLYDDSKEFKRIKNMLLEIPNSLLKNLLPVIDFKLPTSNRLSLYYKPKDIKYLIISLNISKKSKGVTYDFYNIFQDYAFFHFINSAIFPNYNFYDTPEQRNYILEDFIDQGFYIIDFNPFVDNDSEISKIDIEILFENMYNDKLKEIISKSIPIIIIDNKLHNGLYYLLKNAGYNVINDNPIPKPKEENYDNFKELFGNALEKAGYNQT
ncbi:MAG: HNH endonuclease signature motif containing protein [Candidatus Lokiarchaeota archaeon]